MHVQVITAEDRQGQPNHMRYLKELKAWINEAGKTVHAAAYDQGAIVQRSVLGESNDVPILRGLDASVSPFLSLE